FGKKFTTDSGILHLMDDLGKAMAGGEEMLMLGGGNPAYIPQVQQRFVARMDRMLEHAGEYERLIGNYDTPRGEQRFIDALAALLREQYSWDVRPENIALTNGSQTAFFYLFNMFAGECEAGAHRKILLPLAPEYIGYLDVGLTDDFFVASRPEIEYLENHFFKYHIDFDAVSVTGEIGAICVSRPTNPTGNVLTHREIDRLSRLAREHGIPFIIDNAYGTPFPNIMFTDAEPVWDENIILCMSLSKLGLPGPRTGIVIASEQIALAVANMNAIISLAPAAFGAYLALDLVRSGEIIDVSRNVIRPYYRNKVEQAVAWVQEEMEGLDYYIHKPEGTFFLWLWFRDLPITCQQLYERLKARRVLVVPGHYFFPGLREPWQHKHECIRVNYSQAEAVVSEGIRIIAEEVRKAYAGQ
ncbi:MAG: valine--pyruvate transaminase, partial [Anaerolineae bacterium]